jgi:hypothetical protein
MSEDEEEDKPEPKVIDQTATKSSENDRSKTS